MKKNGFVFVESIIVLVVVSLSVAMLISSYSLIARKTKEKETYDKASDKYLLYAISKLGTDENCNYGIDCGGAKDFATSAKGCSETKMKNFMIDCTKVMEYLNIKHLYVVNDIRSLLKSNNFPGEYTEQVNGVTEYLFTNGTIEYMKTLKDCNDLNEYITKSDGTKEYINRNKLTDTCQSPIGYLIGEFERQGTFYYAAIEI